MEIVDVTKENSLIQHFERVAQGDGDSFACDLKELSTTRLKQALKTLDLPDGADKAESIKAIVKKIKEKRMAAKEKKGPAKKAPEKKAEEKKQAKALDTTPAKIIINPKYQKMIDPPTPEQYRMIEASILKDGLQTKLQLLPDRTLWDGHTRYKIMTEHKLPITEDMVEITDLTPEQVEYQIVVMNVFRRHLTDLQKISRIKKFLPQIKAEIKQEKIQKKIEKKADKSTKKAPAGKPGKVADRSITRKKVAEKASVTESSVKIHDWLEKWAPKLLKEALDTGLKPSSAYDKGQQMLKLIKEHAPERLEEIREGKVDLETVHSELLEKLPVEATEPKPGPFETLVTKIKDMYWAVLKKKYGDDVTPDKYEVEVINKLDALVNKYAETEKKS